MQIIKAKRKEKRGGRKGRRGQKGRGKTGWEKIKNIIYT